MMPATTAFGLPHLRCSERPRAEASRPLAVTAPWHAAPAADPLHPSHSLPNLRALVAEPNPALPAPASPTPKPKRRGGLFACCFGGPPSAQSLAHLASTTEDDRSF